MRLVRLTESEDKLLLKRAEMAGMTVSDFIRDISLERKFIPRPPLNDVALLISMRGEIGKMGDRLHQLVSNLDDSQNSKTLEEARIVLEQLKILNAELLNILRHGH